MHIDVATDLYLSHLRVERALSANTISSYGRDLSKFVEHARKRDVEQTENVDLGLVSTWLATLSRSGLASRSMARHLSALRGWLKFLAREGEISEDPTLLAARPRPVRRLPKPLAFEEVEKLLGAPDANTLKGCRDRSLLSLTYAAGLRASEVTGLRIENVDRTRGLVTVTGKGDKRRLVPLGEVCLEHTDGYLAHYAAKHGASPDGWLFPSPRGGPLTRQAFWKIVKRHAYGAGLSARIHPHQLRHSFATHLLSGGADLRTVQTLLGHSNVTTTEIYTKITDDQVRTAHRRTHPRG